jgi:group II intron reverse transcriptase/maturase
MKRGIKQAKSQMHSAGQRECNPIADLFTIDVPVWYEKSGKVSPEWLSICEKERNQTTSLLDKISSISNMQKAYKQVRKNGGSGGIDHQSIKTFGAWFSNNYETLQREIQEGKYRPEKVRGVEIPKAKGGYRQLGIPTIKDRVLEPYYDGKFSERSYGFRPKRGAHQALQKASQIVKSGKSIVIDLDLEKFFDEVNHQRLMWLLGTRIGDKRVLKLIFQILTTGILKGGVEEQRTKGTPQGSPLSPLLSNIVLDELDQELTRRGLEFVRYADDVQIFVSSQMSAERVQKSITKFIENKMKLKVNQTKSGIKSSYEVNFLGHSLLYGGKLGLSQTSEQRLKSKLKTITRRNRGISFEQVLKELRVVTEGWLQYFSLVQMKKKLNKIEGWLRRRLKCYRLKQCKRVITIARFLTKLGVEKTLSWRTALSGKGWWRLSNSPALNIGMNNQWFKEQGYYSLSENYKRLFRSPI